MEELAGILLLVLAGVFLLNIINGNGRAWLRAKFLGQPSS